MKRLFVLVVLVLLLVGTPTRAIAAPATLKQLLQGVAAQIDAQIAAIPKPPVMAADVAALAAWRKAERTVDDAIAHPTPSRAVGYVATVDSALVKALGKTPAVLGVLGSLMDALRNASGNYVGDVRLRVGELPPGGKRTALLARLDAANELVIDSGGAVSRSRARSLLRDALQKGAAVEADRKARVRQILNVKGLVAVAGGVSFKAADLFSGHVAKHAHGGPLRMVLTWKKTQAGVTHQLVVSLDPTKDIPSLTLTPRAYTLGSAFNEAQYTRSGGSEDPMDVLASVGAITIATLDTKDPAAPVPNYGRAAVAGWFSFVGPDVSGPGSGVKVSGTFNVAKYPKGPQVVDSSTVPKSSWR